MDTTTAKYETVANSRALAVLQKLWPWLRMLPISGCDRELLESVVEASELLGMGDESKISLSQLGAVERSLDADASERFASWLESSRWINRMEKTYRQRLLSEVRAGSWMQGE